MDGSRNSIEKWTTQARKGLLELCVLNALEGGERYAYSLVKSLVNVKGLDIAEGTIYPLLSRLRTQGLVETRLVESTEGPARKYYQLSDEGRKQLELMNRYFAYLLEGMESLKEGGVDDE